MNTNRIASELVVVLALGLGAGCAENVSGPVAVAPTATNMLAASSTTLRAVAGSVVSEQPAVIVRDQHGAPMMGVPVVFTIVSGSGSLSEPSGLTDASGKATLGKWTLSRRTESSVVRAAAPPSLRVEFSATGVAGPPVALVKISGDNQVAPPGASVMSPPAVLVVDSNENNVVDVAVEFAITSGGGSVSGERINTGISGVARLGLWVLGLSGEQSVTATVAGLAPLVFSATSSGDPCKFIPELAAGSTSLKELNSLACALPDGRSSDSYSIFSDGAQTLSIGAQSTVFNTSLVLTRQDGDTVAQSVGTASSIDAQFKLHLASGTYILAATSRTAGEAGLYSLTSRIVSEEVTACEEMILTRGVTTEQSLARGDCDDTTGKPHDDFRIHLTAGAKIVVSMISEEVDCRLEISDMAGGSAKVAGETLEYTAPATGYYHIRATTVYAWGKYSLTIQ